MVKNLFKDLYKKFLVWLSATLETYNPAIVAMMKDKAIKFAVKKVLGTAVSGGYRFWIVKYVTKELYEKIAEPLVDLYFANKGYKVDRELGKIALKEVENAQDVDEWFDAVTSGELQEHA